VTLDAYRLKINHSGDRQSGLLGSHNAVHAAALSEMELKLDEHRCAFAFTPFPNQHPFGMSCGRRLISFSPA
jgi:hypothetical protein